MTLTILASVFLAFILLIAFIGFKAAISRTLLPPDELNMERCSVCREKFSKTALIERQIGDYKLLYFCQSCIAGLHNELVSKN